MLERFIVFIEIFDCIVGIRVFMVGFLFCLILDLVVFRVILGSFWLSFTCSRVKFSVFNSLRCHRLFKLLLQLFKLFLTFLLLFYLILLSLQPFKLSFFINVNPEFIAKVVSKFQLFVTNLFNILLGTLLYLLCFVVLTQISKEEKPL